MKFKSALDITFTQFDYLIKKYISCVHSFDLCLDLALFGPFFDFINPSNICVRFCFQYLWLRASLKALLIVHMRIWCSKVGTVIVAAHQEAITPIVLNGEVENINS